MAYPADTWITVSTDFPCGCHLQDRIGGPLIENPDRVLRSVRAALQVQAASHRHMGPGHDDPEPLSIGTVH